MASRVQSEAVFGSGEGTVSDRAHVIFDSLLNALGALHEVAHEFRLFPRKHPKQVVQHQHLAGAVAPRAYAYGGDGECFCELNRYSPIVVPEIALFR